MKITIDERKCDKHKISITEVLLALAIRSVPEIGNTFKEMIRKGIIKKTDDTFTVNEVWDRKINEITRNYSTVLDNDARLTNLAIALKEIYPSKALRSDRIAGIVKPDYLKSNDKEIAHHLKMFFTEYGDFSDEEIIEATKRYIKDECDGGSYSRIRRLKYFIFKNDRKENVRGSLYVEQLSPLADYLENRNEKEEETNPFEDWTTKLI